MSRDYQQYKDEVIADVGETLRDAGCQPIIFVGSGFSKRFASAPKWDELLRGLAEACPLIDKSYGYYKQTYNDPMRIGSVFADLYREWAWGVGRDQFPDEYFDESVPGDIFIKHKVAELLSNLGPDKIGSYGSVELDAEIEALRSMNPHAIVTTNYDELVEQIFPEYSRIIGQTILRQPYLAVGEVFKIHGCVSVPASLVLTKEDYEEFESDKKYLSAKLLTYFAEHPLLFIGYSATDPNIKSVLYDVDRMIKADFQLIPNIYILEFSEGVTDGSYPPHDRVLAVGEGREIRIKTIAASDYSWVFKAFSNGGALEKVNMKLLRALMARTYDLVRKDVPTQRVEIDFQTLDKKLSEGHNIATLLGIASLDHASKFNVSYPYTLTTVAAQLGYSYWYYANKLIDKVTKETGVNIKSFDNGYHVTVVAGSKTTMHKYSQAVVDLLKLVQAGQPYSLAKDCDIDI